MAYKAYGRDTANQKWLFFDSDSPREDLALIEAKLTTAVNSAGEFTFTMAKSNTTYYAMDVPYRVELYQDDERIFTGRVSDISRDFKNNITVSCEGAFAYFNDTVIRDELFNGGTHTYSGSLQNLVSGILTVHNREHALADGKRIILGTIEPTDSSLTIQKDSYETAMSWLQDLQDLYGGYMEVSYSGNNNYGQLNWKNNLVTSTQTIDFGKNLLDLEQSTSLDGLMTVLIPLGASLGTERLNIKDVNGDLDYLVMETGYGYGKIVAVKIWDKIKSASKLMAAGQKYLRSIESPQININVSALDIARTFTESAIGGYVFEPWETGLIVRGGTYTVGAASSAHGGYFVDEDGMHLRTGMKVKVNSEAHGLTEDNVFVIEQMTVDLLNPATSKIVLNKKVKGYIARTNSERQ